MEMSGHLHAPAALPPGIGGWVGPPAHVWTLWRREKWKIPNSNREFNPEHPIVQPIASRYTDWAVPANNNNNDNNNGLLDHLTTLLQL
jgi:hypothetical protein